MTVHGHPPFNDGRPRGARPLIVAARRVRRQQHLERPRSLDREERVTRAGVDGHGVAASGDVLNDVRGGVFWIDCAAFLQARLQAFVTVSHR